MAVVAVLKAHTFEDLEGAERAVKTLAALRKGGGVMVMYDTSPNSLITVGRLMGSLKLNYTQVRSIWVDWFTNAGFAKDELAVQARKNGLGVLVVGELRPLASFVLKPGIADVELTCEPGEALCLDLVSRSFWRQSDSAAFVYCATEL